MLLAAVFYLVAFLTATWSQPEGDEELSNCDDCNSGVVSLQHIQMYGNNQSSYVVSLLCCGGRGRHWREKVVSLLCCGENFIIAVKFRESLLWLWYHA